MKDLSILIPTFNHDCAALVAELQRQAAALGIGYEIIVGDDGSTDGAVILANRRINAMEGCRVEERRQNEGRAAIRNFLARQARYAWLVFIDSDMVVCREDFLRRYAEVACDGIAYGGVTISGVERRLLRAVYEQAAAHKHTAEHRRQRPYHDFHTANFMVRRDLMLAHPFDARFRHYGYEDVLFGKTMEHEGIGILHIDNPMSFEVFESNAEFISKTEEGLRTLHQFRTELADYSTLLALAGRHRWLLPVMRCWHRLAGGWERRQLTGSKPSLTLFSLYRLGYFAMLDGKRQ